MAANTFIGTKNLIPEQNLRISERPMFQTKWFGGTKLVAGSVVDDSSPGEPLSPRVMTLFTAAFVMIDQTITATDGTYSFPHLRDDINDVADGLIVTKQYLNLDGYAQMRDRIVAV